MSVDTLEKPQSAEQGDSPQEKKSWFDWKDPTVPVGNSPPIPRWPLVVATMAWVGWVVFLFAMMIKSGSSA